MLDSAGLRPTAAASYTFDAAAPRRAASASADVLGGLRLWRLAAALAWIDVRNRYRGSVLGPLWLTLSTAAMLGGLGLLYSTLFRIPIGEYLPHLAVSLVAWNAISALVVEATGSMAGAEGIIRQMRLPYTVHALRCLFRNAITAAHSLPLVLVVFAATGHWPGAEALLVLPGIALIAVDGLAAVLLLGMLCARFRDIGPIVANVMQLAFFMTPIMWKPELLGEAQAWLPLNPFYAVLEMLRGPLVEGGGPLVAWLAALGYSAALVVVAALFFVRFRSRIAFWV